MYLSAHCAPRSRVRIDIPRRETRARGILIELTRAVFPAVSHRVMPARVHTTEWGKKTPIPRNHDDWINLVPGDTGRWIKEFFRANISEEMRHYFAAPKMSGKLLRDAIGTENLLRSRSVGHVHAARVMNISVRVIHAMTAEWIATRARWRLTDNLAVCAANLGSLGAMSAPSDSIIRKRARTRKCANICTFQ